MIEIKEERKTEHLHGLAAGDDNNNYTCMQFTGEFANHQHMDQQQQPTTTTTTTKKKT